MEHPTRDEPITPADASKLPIYTDIDDVPLTLLEQLSGHWRATYITKKREHDVSIKQIVWGQLLTVLLVGSASYFLEANKSALLLIGSALILYPSLSNLFSSNATALSATLHHEVDSTEGFNTVKMILRSLLQSLVVALLASFVIGILSGLFGAWLFQAGIAKTISLALLVGGGTALIGLPLSVGIVFFVRNTHSNPDDIVSPLSNMIFSILPLALIIITSRWLA